MEVSPRTLITPRNRQNHDPSLAATSGPAKRAEGSKGKAMAEALGRRTAAARTPAVGHGVGVSLPGFMDFILFGLRPLLRYRTSCLIFGEGHALGK